jgi:transcriptional regulator with XRE-family HTH domain
MPDSALATFAAELKAWRERMGLTQSAFADKIGYSVALVSAVEQCKRSPTADFAARCDALTSAPGTFARWQAQVARESYPAFFAPVVAFERDEPASADTRGNRPVIGTGYRHAAP